MSGRSPVLGFLGCGALTEAVVDGLLAGRTGDDAPRIVLSPRSEAVSTRIVARRPQIRRARDNAELVGASDVVFLVVRPAQLEEAVAGLPFRPDQTVVSFLAGTPRDDVAALVAPAARVLRLNALPPIRLGKGPIVLHPPDSRIARLFAPLGEVIEVEREGLIDAVCNASAVMSSHYEMQNRVVAWLESRDMPARDAARYVRALFAGLAEMGVRSLDEPGGLVPDHHETPGGLNAHGRRRLRAAGWFDAVGRALDSIEVHGRILRAPTDRDRG